MRIHCFPFHGHVPVTGCRLLASRWSSSPIDRHMRRPTCSACTFCKNSFVFVMPLAVKRDKQFTFNAPKVGSRQTTTTPGIGLSYTCSSATLRNRLEHRTSSEQEDPKHSTLPCLVLVFFLGGVHVHHAVVASNLRSLMRSWHRISTGALWKVFKGESKDSMVILFSVLVATFSPTPRSTSCSVDVDERAVSKMTSDDEENPVAWIGYLVIEVDTTTRP